MGGSCFCLLSVPRCFVVFRRKPKGSHDSGGHKQQTQMASVQAPPPIELRKLGRNESQSVSCVEKSQVAVSLWGGNPFQVNLTKYGPSESSKVNIIADSALALSQLLLWGATHAGWGSCFPQESKYLLRLKDTSTPFPSKTHS